MFKRVAASSVQRGKFSPDRFRAPLCALALAFAAGAIAQNKPDAVIHYRQSVMAMIGWNFAPLGAMVKGKTAFDAGEFARRAERLDFLSQQSLEGFSKGSDKGAETDAKAAIWENFDDFRAKNDDFVSAAKALGEIAKSGDETKMKEQFKKMAGTCKACHEKYRAD